MSGAAKQPWTSAPFVRVDNVSIRYEQDHRAIVRDCSFSFSRGELVLITGPSGCGKSTLAMALAGIIPNSVEAEVDGRIWLDDDLKGPGKIGYVFQDPETQFCMRQVGDEIAFGLENLKVERDDMPERIEWSLAMVNLDVPCSANHASFSGGMKQKLAIACALAMDAELLILDEPTANLDPQSTRTVFEQIVALRRQGRTVVVIEHKYEPLLPYVDRIVSLSREGQVEGVFESAEAWRSAVEPNPVPVRQPSREALSAASGAFAGDDAVPLLLEASGVALSYGQRTVWTGVDLALRRGEWVAIVGPNGAGKSSLLEVLAGLRKPSAGEVRLQGQPLAKIPKSKRYAAISYGFQNPEYQFLFERVIDEMAGRVVGDDRPADTLEQLAEFGLSNLALASPYELSQGQKRRLAVATMLGKRSDVWLFDEPTYGQDAQTERLILEKLKARQMQQGTVVTVTHDMDLVRAWATRVVVLADGGILYDGSVDGLFERGDVLAAAHLLDDVLDIEEDGNRETSNKGRSLSPQSSPQSSSQPRRMPAPRRSPFGMLHPGCKGLALVAMATIILFAWNFAQLGRLWALVIVAAFGLSWCNPWKMMVRLSPALAAYLIYLWTFAANAAVPPGTPSVHWLWYNISWYGMWKGVLVALRTLSTVVLGYVMLVSTDGTDFAVSLSQTFRVSPKLAYGIMAGTGFIGSFQRDLEVLRMARSLRGRQGWWIFHPVSYALPLLSQAVRVSERMAVAMEARGFFGDPAQFASRRTYFRVLRLRPWDVAFSAGLVIVPLVLLFV